MSDAILGILQNIQSSLDEIRNLHPVFSYANGVRPPNEQHRSGAPPSINPRATMYWVQGPVSVVLSLKRWRRHGRTAGMAIK
jgi:hypothetical protein